MGVDDYNRRAIAALLRAQHLVGTRSANAFARLLAERGHGPPSPSTYRRWIAGEAVVPAWALEVAAEVAGTTLHALLEDATEPAADDWRARIEDAIGRLEGEMIEVRERVGLPWQTDTASNQPKTAQKRPAT